MSTELTCRLRSANPVITNALSAQDNFNKVQHLSFIRLRAVSEGNELMNGVPEGNELMNGVMQATQEEMKYALPIERKIPIRRNRCVRSKNHVGNTRIQAVSKEKGLRCTITNQMI